ncbi:alpha-hydroxy-acid oxidizing enzyme [Bordetella bronchialis]|uniref:Alpha-hydroxy-acid oxidizing enzyme n=2 Tax=Bordetella bronchialis TaxID=463025 RepID=A0A193FMU0_9BORD|nr:alpha-hydroxy-acid oxidizing enzyme [Bordetella bronchialis]ANN74129.1 alpha-hydroxy-acid oxidizing enzyme [Bordetella bronchialis]
MSAVITCVEDLRAVARKRVPRLFYDYVDSGSWSESTYRANASDLARLNFCQRVGCNVADIRMDTRILGQPVSMPVGLAPAGLAGMVHPDGEILAARAAAAFGVPYVLSTVSICSIEDLARHAAAPFWFQLYVMKDRDFIERLVERARAAGCPALVLTMDLPIQGQRHKDIRNGLSVPPRMTLRGLSALLARPRWCAGMLRTSRRTFGNIVGHAKGVGDTLGFSEWVSRQFDRTVSWDDVQWLKQRWGGKLVVKGVMDARDARRAVDAGADAIIVSNHGGRQLDGAPSSIRALPAVAQAVGGRAEIYLDGGVRSGQDVLRALALGANAAFIGRAYMYGLGAYGQAGVARCLDILRRELESTMTLCGLTRVQDASPDLIVNPYTAFKQQGDHA